MIKRHPEPLLWMLFSAGGGVSALLMPALLALFGVAIPLGWIAAPDHEHLRAVVTHPLTRVALLGLCVLSLCHSAHRLRHTMYVGLQIKPLTEVAAFVAPKDTNAGS